MRIHREGFQIILMTTIVLFIINYFVIFAMKDYLADIVLIVSIVIYIFLLWFFRNPNRAVILDRKAAISPCDGKVVIIREISEDEFFKDKRIQISIFMSPLNVHINWFPISGIVQYVKHHRGRFMAAWKPKSSLLNERNTIVIKSPDGVPILMRQIAGAMARRIVSYVKPGSVVLQSKEAGFIRFGSRVDIILPLNSKLLVKEGQVVKGARTRIAYLK